jgi:hypothetical protein
MNGRADHFEVPVLSAWPGAVLRAKRSQYGDYFDFELRAVSIEGGGDVLGPQPVVHVSGYASRTQVVALEVGESESGTELGSAVLIVGNTRMFLLIEHGQTLATFLGVELERK